MQFNILQQLFANEDEGFINLEAFSKNKRELFDAAGIDPEDLNMEVPIIPDDCQVETKQAAFDLEYSIVSLGKELAYEKWLLDLLLLACGDIVDKSNAVIATI